MKKKFVSLLLLILTVCLSLTACTVVDCLHEYDKPWQFDQTSHWHKCKYCDAISDEEPHRGGKATCTNKAVCEVCGQPYGDFGEHTPDGNYLYDEESHWQQCSVCKELLPATAHRGGKATCTSKAVCEVCGQPYGDFGDHAPDENYLYDEENHWQQCSVCKENLPATAHRGGKATCTSKAICEICGQPYGDLGDHEFDEHGVCKHCKGTLALKYTAATPYEVSTLDDLLHIAALLDNDADLTDCHFKQTQNIDISSVANWTPIGTIGLPFGGVYIGNNCEVSGLTIDTDASFLGLFGFVTGSVCDLTVRGNIRGINDGENNVGYAHTFAGGIVGAINNGASIENCTSYVDITGDAFVGGIVGEIMETDYLLFGTRLSTVKDCTNYGKITAYAKSAKNEEAMYFGGIAGRNNGYVLNCANYGEVDGDTYSADAEKKDRYVGGIVGYSYIPFKNGAGPNNQMNYVAVSDCKNYGFVHGTYAVGGIIGQGVFSVKNCQNEGTVQGVNCVGGIMGIGGTKATLSYACGTISNCTNKGQVLSTERNAGGIVGYNYVNIDNCTNENQGVIAAATDGRAYYIGGIAGTNENGTITLCNNYGDVVGTADARTVNGGIVGQLLGGTVARCDNYAQIKGLGCVGGIVGNDGENYTSQLDACNNYGIVEGTTFVGGICGATYRAAVTDCHNNGTVSGTSDVGGNIGWLSGSAPSVTDCTNSADGKVTATANYAGGIVGRIGSNGQENVATLQNCVNRAEVVGNTYVGGITGGVSAAPSASGNNNITVIECRNEGGISATQYAGGIVGVIPKYTNGKIANCTNTGNVQIEKYRAGGIVGSVEPTRGTSGGDFTIDLCNNGGNVTSATGAWIGGIVGMHGSYVFVRGCKNSGDITGVGSGNYGIGGISGSTYTNSEILSFVADDGTTVATEVSGTITGKSGCTGEIVGKNTKNSEVVATSTATVVNI